MLFRPSSACASVTPSENSSPPPIGTPCGMCRQTLAEFASDMPIQVADLRGEARTLETTLAELLPHAFRGDALAAGLSSD